MAIKDVVVNISKQPLPGNTGVGTPLVIQGKAETAVSYTECHNVEDVVSAGFEVETPVYKQCAAIFEQDNKPNVIAVCATQGKIADELPKLKNQIFRQIIPVLGAEDTLAELVTYVDKTEDKMIFTSVNASTELSAVKSDRVFAIVYSGKSTGVEGAVVGASAGYKAGEITYKNLILKGIEPEDLTETQIDQIHKAGGICILRKAGDVVTSEGIVTSGEYADVIDGIDYILNNIAYESQKLLNTNPKTPFTDIGISQLETVTYSVLSKAYSQGIIDETEKGAPDFETNFMKRSELPQQDIKERTYNGGYFNFAIMGAIHYAKINGVLTI